MNVQSNTEILYPPLKKFKLQVMLRASIEIFIEVRVLPAIFIINITYYELLVVKNRKQTKFTDKFTRNP